MALFLSIFPIALLIFLMVKRKAWPSYVALPWIAAVILIIQLVYFETDIVTVSANIVSALVAVQTPITVIFGAILFNRFSEVAGVTNTLRKWLGNINPNPVAQLMIIGWAFAFMIEGASGFGTPAAIAAPILVGLGFPPLRVAMLVLVMNSVPVSFGAVGTPTWFGFAPLQLTMAQTLDIGAMSALIHAVAAMVIPVMALRFVVSWAEIRKNLTFIYLSIFACVLPYVAIAFVNYEFPALVGGAFGLLVSVFLANKGIGLAKEEKGAEKSTVSSRELFKALLPTGMLIFILIVTRLKQLPLKAWLTDTTPWFGFHLGSLGEFEVSRGLVLSLKDIFDTGIQASYKVLYVPAFIPFIITVLIAALVFSLKGKEVKGIFTDSLQKTRNPFLALVGALIMVRLMLVGGDGSMVKIIGKSFAEYTGEYWTIFAAYLGAIGSFFSGSNTVSNLTFGSVQLSTAELTGLSATLILALQSVGGAMGNMVCINNIVAVSSVLNMEKQEGAIIKRTIVPMMVYGVIAALVALFIIPMIF